MTKPMQIPLGNDENVSGDDVKSDVVALRSDVEKLMGDMARIATQEVKAGVESTGEMRDAVEKEIQDFSDRARVYVRDNPLGACAAAVAAGFAAALLLKK